MLSKVCHYADFHCCLLASQLVALTSSQLSLGPIEAFKQMGKLTRSLIEMMPTFSRLLLELWCSSDVIYWEIFRSLKGGRERAVRIQPHSETLPHSAHLDNEGSIDLIFPRFLSSSSLQLLAFRRSFIFVPLLCKNTGQCNWNPPRISRECVPSRQCMWFFLWEDYQIYTC